MYRHNDNHYLMKLSPALILYNGDIQSHSFIVLLVNINSQP